MSFSIKGKTAIVTGGAHGIGLAIGQHFADRGANVVFADIDEAQLKNEIGPNQDGTNIRYFAGDLRQKLTLANLLSPEAMTARLDWRLGSAEPRRGRLCRRTCEALRILHPKLGNLALAHQLGIGDVTGLGDHLRELMCHAANDLIAL